MQVMTYRADIDGLRALAIVPVLFFHAGVPGFSGGFVGVDVFFVISGYLITSLIQGEIREGRFTISGFYERRIRRIFPALFSVVLACALAALFVLLPEDLVAFARSVIATALFGSNVLFWRESGYFASPAELKPLLHTWSLAIEEQFYLVFPVFLVLAHRWLKTRVAALVAAIAVISFAACVLFTAEQPEAAFFLAPFRMWELLLGALAALRFLPRLGHPALRGAAALAGIAMIAASVLLLSAATAFPGVNALYPCLGTLLIILAGEDEGEAPRVTKALRWKPLVFIGLISYSLYLWHWPLLVFLKYEVQRALRGGEIAGVLALSFVLAWVSWRYVERPFRRPGAQRRGKKIFVQAAAAMLLAAGTGSAALQSAGWPARDEGYAPVHVRGREDYRDGSCFLAISQSFGDWSKSAPCLIDHQGRDTVLIWGDSFAAHYVPGIESAPAAREHNFVQYTASSCPPVLGARIASAPRCEDFNSHLETVLDRYRIGTVIVAARWERYWRTNVDRAMVEATLGWLKARHLRVVLVGQGPSFAFSSPPEYLYRTRRDHARSIDDGAINAELRRAAGYDAFFDPAAFLCPDGDCPLRKDGRYLYFDGGHYSSYGSGLAAAALLRLLAAP